MSVFKVVNNELVIRKLDIPKVAMNVMTDIQESYQEYLTSTVHENIAYLQELLRTYPGLEDLRIEAVVEPLVQREYMKTQVNNGDYYYPVYCKFYLNGRATGTDSKSGWEVLRIPYMDDYGHINMQGKSKVVLNLQRPDDCCSYTKSKEMFNLSTPERNLRIMGTMSSISIRHNNKNQKVTEVLESMMYLAGDETKLSDIFTNTILVRALNYNPYTVYENVYTMRSKQNDAIERILATKEYHLGSARASLNKIARLERGIGYQLSRPVLNYVIGTKVTQEVVDNLYRNHINHYQIFCTELPENYLYAGDELIAPTAVYRGTQNCALLRRLLPQYAMQDYFLQDVEVEEPLFILTAGRKVTREIMEYLTKVGYTNLLVSAGKNKKSFLLSFEREIVGNYTAPLYKLTDEFGGRSSEEMIYYYNNPNLESVAHDNLTCHDLMVIISVIGQSMLLGSSGLLDRDTAYLKKVLMVNEVFSETLRNTMREYVRHYHNAIQTKIKQTTASNPFVGLTKEWYKTLNQETYIAPADTLNLAAEVSQVNHVCTIMGANAEVSDALRHLATPYFSRICPYETPAGKKLGLVNTRAIGVKTKDGIGHIPVYQVHNLQGGIGIDTKHLSYLDQNQELEYKLGDILSIKWKDKGNGIMLLDPDEIILARVPDISDNADEPFKFRNIRAAELSGHYVTAYPEQFVSTTAALIPFACSDDAVRISYGLSQMRQAIYLINSEKPLVKTPMYEDILSYSNSIKFNSPVAGTVTKVNNMLCEVTDIRGKVHTVLMQGSSFADQHHSTIDICVKVGDTVTRGQLVGEIFKFPQTFCVRAPYSGTVIEIGEDFMTMRRDNHGNAASSFINLDDVDTIYLQNFRITGHSVVLLSLHVAVGQHINKGDIIADTYASRGGCYSPSRNALVAYMSTGYNYEDGIHATEKASVNYMSINTHHMTQTVSTKRFPSISAKLPSGFKYCSNGDVALEIKCKKKIGERVPDVSLPIRATNREHGIPFEQSRNSTNVLTREYTVNLLGLNKLDVGDKMAGRHGNKGVVSKVSPDSEAPQLLNGITVEIILNPCGVPSRMNLGQVYDALLGLVAHITGVTIDTEAFNSATPDDIALLLMFVWELANTTAIGDNITKQYHRPVFDAICDKYPELPREYFDLVWPHIENIIDWRGVFNPDGTAKLYDPITDTMFDGEALIGFAYFNKQEQEVEEKINVRGGLLTEDYARNNAQPQKGEGSAKGQRMGEMEIVDLAAYGAASFLQEVINEKSDNPGLRVTRHMEQLGMETNESHLEMSSRATENLLYYLEAMGIGMEVPREIADVSMRESILKSSLNINHAILSEPAFHSHSEKARVAMESESDFDNME